MENRGLTGSSGAAGSGWRPLHTYLAVLVFAAAVYLTCVISPPSLQDDVDAVQAQIARNMLSSGDWVTARLDGIPYLEKAPLIYWLIGTSYKVFGVTDWAARIPVALSAILLALVTAAFAQWAFGKRAGLYAGLSIATCVGLFLFTRIQIPDVMLTLTTTVAVWAFLRVFEPEEQRPTLWASVFAASVGLGLLLKSLIAVVFPLGAGLIYLLLTGRLLAATTWKRLRPLTGTLIVIAVAAPWHILAILRNPPYFAFTMHSIPGEYHGFFWFYFFNEQLLRFLNLRYPRDYDTVPRLYFWLLHLLWLFPWSVYFAAVPKLSFRALTRAGRTRLMCLCWIGLVLLFFSFSTTQEYYSMQSYPALALLLGSAMALEENHALRAGRLTLAVISVSCAGAIITILVLVRSVPTPGDISSALSYHPTAYKLSLGHMQDLTLASFAYLRLPLALAAVAFLIGAVGNFRQSGVRAAVATGVMMVVFFQAARLALVTFDPFLSSRPLAEVLKTSPPGRLIVDHHYYTFSSIFFYTDRTALLRNGRINNMVYGSYAPGAPNVFIDDAQFEQLWRQPERSYIVAADSAIPGLEKLAGVSRLDVVARSGGKTLLTNMPIPARISAKYY